jgi:hypothetical protein
MIQSVYNSQSNLLIKMIHIPTAIGISKPIWILPNYKCFSHILH